METENRKSIFRYAAELGPVLGIWFTLMSVLMVVSMYWSIANIAFMGMLVGIPVLVYKLMRRVARSEPAYSTFWSLWTLGIYLFIFGALLCAIVNAVYVVYVNPGFLHQYFNAMLDPAVSSADPAAAQQAAALRNAIEMNGFPSGMEFVMSMLWSTAFFGSILSLPLAMLARAVENARMMRARRNINNDN